MRKILILANHDVGLYNFRAELVERLIHEGFDVHFSVPFGNKVPLLEEIGAIWHPVAMNRRGKNPAQDLKLLRYYFLLIRKVRPIIVLTYTAKPNIYGGLACQIAGVPQLANITGLGSELHGNGKAAKLIRWLYRVGLKKAKGIFFQNEANRAYFVENGLVSKDMLRRSCKKVSDNHEKLPGFDAQRKTQNAQRLITLPGSGVNTDRFKPCTDKSFSDTGTARFLFISRIMQDKGIGEFLAAAENVKAQYPGCSFQILGFYESDAYKVQIESLLKRGVLDGVSFSEDTRIEMAKADCVVLPSWHEGMSNVLLEAAASGLPIITSDIPGCREAVIDDVSGYLCNKKDIGSLTAQMIRFVSLDSEAKSLMGQAGRQLMLARFDRNIVIEAYISELSRIQEVSHA